MMCRNILKHYKSRRYIAWSPQLFPFFLICCFFSPHLIPLCPIQPYPYIYPLAFPFFLYFFRFCYIICLCVLYFPIFITCSIHRIFRAFMTAYMLVSFAILTCFQLFWLKKFTQSYSFPRFNCFYIRRKYIKI